MNNLVVSDRCSLKLNPEISIPTPKFKIGQRIFNLVGDKYDWYLGYVLEIKLNFSDAELNYKLSSGDSKTPVFDLSGVLHYEYSILTEDCIYMCERGNELSLNVSLKENCLEMDLSGSPKNPVVNTSEFVCLSVAETIPLFSIGDLVTWNEESFLVTSMLYKIPRLYAMEVDRFGDFFSFGWHYMCWVFEDGCLYDLEGLAPESELKHISCHDVDWRNTFTGDDAY